MPRRNTTTQQQADESQAVVTSDDEVQADMSSLVIPQADDSAEGPDHALTQGEGEGDEPETSEPTGPSADQIAETREVLEAAIGEGQLQAPGVRVRITFEDRKMAVPGRIRVAQDGTPWLHTNWGLDLNLAAEPITGIEVKNLDSGKFVTL